jgi:bifunctional non-homologous end joining protein LigD
VALQAYRKKRDFKRSDEPRGTVPAASSGQSFVVQKHAASHLHYDFRLEKDGVLLSWAVPKGPSLDPSDKRLAMQVEDHPLEYSGFEGRIPKGEYGGGTVMVWDRGTWTPDGDPDVGYRQGNLKFTLNGDKLHGRWVLVRTRSTKYGGKRGDQAWLLIKEKDAYARSKQSPIVDTAPNSVASGRSMEAIAEIGKNVWHSSLSPAANIRAGALKSTTRSPAALSAGYADPPNGAKKARLPAFVAPTLATLVQDPPEGSDWINEIKYDGYRMVCRIRGGSATLLSRSAKNWTNVFPAIARELGSLPVNDAWIDGEVVALDSDGRSSFQALQNALGGEDTSALSFFAFDIMYRDGYDLRTVQLSERKRVLHEVVGEGGVTVRIGPEVRGGGTELFKQAGNLHLEGIISKKADSLYADGKRTRQWLKIKTTQRQELVIGGYTDPQGSRTGFGALLLGYYDADGLRYAGKVGTGFDDKLLRELLPQLKRRGTDQPAFVNPPRGFAAKGVHWIKPELVAEVTFAEWSDDGALRHPSFKGLRIDKKAREVVRERPGTTPRPSPSPKNRSAELPIPVPAKVEPDASSEMLRKLTHPTKLYFPEAGLTKADLAKYYLAVSEYILPHIAGRPLSLVRCPDGWSKQCFYQKHAAPAVDAAVQRIEVPEGGGHATYLRADSAAALVALVQWGVIELHPWGSAYPRLDRPNRLIFDFDPDERLPWKEIVTSARLLRTLLEEVELQGFLKTTGGKGLHVVVPIRPTLTWDDAKGFTKGIAEFLARTFPDRFVASMSKGRRKGKIFIDYLRNAEGSTAIAPYAVRARSKAPVSTPIGWDELERDLRFDHFNIVNIPARLADQGAGAWKGFFAVKQTVNAALRRRFI